MDQHFKDLIEASSLGTPAARRIRSSTTSEVIDDVHRRIEDRREPSLKDAAASAHQPATHHPDSAAGMPGGTFYPILARLVSMGWLKDALSQDDDRPRRRISARVAIRLHAAEQTSTGRGWLAAYQDVQASKADWLRAQHASLDASVRHPDEDLAAHRVGEPATAADPWRDEAAQQAQVAAETAQGSRKHQRLPRWIRLLPTLVLALDFGLLLYFFAGITGVNWANLSSAALVAAVASAAMVSTLLYGFLGFAGSRLRGHKNHSGSIAIGDLDGLTRTACGAVAAGVAVIAVLMLIRTRTEVLAALGPQSSAAALMIALVLAVVSLLANYLVVIIRALDGSAEIARLDFLGSAVSRPLAWPHQLFEQANAALDRQIAVLPREAERCASKEINQFRDLAAVGLTLHQGAGPHSEPAAESDGKDSVIGDRRTKVGPKVDKRRPGSRRLTGNVGRAAAVVAIAAAVAVTTFAVRFGATSPPGGTKVVIAATATTNEPAPALSADVLQMLQSADITDPGATAYIVAPGGGQPTILSLAPREAGGQADQAPAREKDWAAELSTAQRLLQHEAAHGPLDLLATVAVAARAVSPPATLIVVSSGLSTAGGFDLQDVGWDASPSAIANELKSHGQLPDLAGYHVVFSGLSNTSGGQPALPLPQQATLVSYWTAICQAAGAASCTTDESTRPEPPSHSITPVPVVPVPNVTSERGPHNSVITTVPDTLLFTFNGAALIPFADEVLQPLALEARSEHLQVSITGYASPAGGTSAYNLALSLQRANAVRDRLIHFGLPAAQIIGVTGAGTAGQTPSACLMHGQLNEALCEQLRRVVIVLSPTKANPRT